MVKKNIQGMMLKAMRLEDEILDQKTASDRVYKHHWMHEYFQRRYELKVREWERLTHRKYEDNKGNP